MTFGNGTMIAFLVNQDTQSICFTVRRWETAARMKARPERDCLDLVEANLRTLTSSLPSRLTLEFQKLTTTEFEIAQLVMRGKSTKEIAWMFSRSTSTIDFHRNNIRAKLGLSRNQNLRTYLHSAR